MIRRLVLLTLLVALTAHHAEAQQPKSDPQSARLLNPATRSAVDRAFRYLTERQHENGSFGSGGNSQENVAVASLCGMAFLSAGHTPGRGPHGNTVQEIVDFVLSRCQPSGYIVSEERSIGQGPMYGHGFATLFLAETYGMTKRPELRAKLSRAVELIIATQNADGGWRYYPLPEQEDVSVTVCQMVALRGARNAGIAVPKETVDRCVEYLKECQNRDGGFRYQIRGKRESRFPRTAAGIVGLNSAGIYKGSEVLRAVAYLERNRPSDRNAGAQDYFFYGHYYASQAMWQIGGARWQSWYRQTRDELLAKQGNSGGWSEEFVCPEYGTAMAVLVLQMPKNYLPIFER